MIAGRESETRALWRGAALVALVAARGRHLVRDGTATRDGHVTLCACALAIVPLALTAVRNVPPFLMLAVPAIGARRVIRSIRFSACSILFCRLLASIRDSSIPA